MRHLHLFRRTAAAALALLVMPCVDAGGLKAHYDIPAQSLAAALKNLAATGDLQLVYSPEVVAGMRSRALKGEYTPLEALDRLIAPAGLTYAYDGKDTIVVKRKSTAALPVAAEGAQLRLAQVTGNEPGKRSSAAQAQSEEDEMVVTGTSIKGVAPAGSPVLVINEEDIQRSGYTTTDQLLQSLPQNVRSGASGASADVELSAGTQASLNNSRGSGVNLRGLGTVATLTLINGRRIAASTSGTYTDISVIPLNAIERIEVLTDGASAIYGADAVAGVVNIILKRRYTGAETSARHGATTEKGRSETRLTQSMGTGWGDGNILVVADYLHQSKLSGTERRSTSNLRQPTTVFPTNQQLGLVLSGEQRFGERWSLHSDVQYMTAERTGEVATTPVPRVAYRLNETERLNAALGLTYSPFSDWDFTLDAVHSTEEIDFTFTLVAPTGVIPGSSTIQNQKQEQWNAGLVANGTIFDMPGGRAGLALGVNHREEEYNRLRESLSGFIFPPEPATREIDSAFAELHLPLVGVANQRGGVQMSLAGRYDDYTDFGSTFNPKVGLSWMATEGLELRASYSTSFRAPSTGRELSDSQKVPDPVAFVYDFLDPDSTDDTDVVPVVVAYGSNQLTPEESENWTLGMTWRPAALEGMQVGLTYYHIDYSDQIVIPPFNPRALRDPALRGFATQYSSPQALRAAIIEQLGPDAFFIDFTDTNYGGPPEDFATYYYEQRYVNVGKVTTSGVDLTVDYGFQKGVDRFNLGLNVNYIGEIDYFVSPDSPAYDLTDTTGNPANMRLRSTAGWSRGAFDGALNVNYVNGYNDTFGLIPRGVSSYMTIDVNLRYELQGAGLLEGVMLGLNVVNALDEEPPFVNSTGAPDASPNPSYDPANASPLGRMIGVQISKRW